MCEISVGTWQEKESLWRDMTETMWLKKGNMERILKDGNSVLLCRSSYNIVSKEMSFLFS